MKAFLTVLGLTAVALAVATALVVLPDRVRPSATAPARGAPQAPEGNARPLAPWQVERLPQGRSKVAGLVLGGTPRDTPPVATLADVLRLWPQESTVAVIMPSGGASTLEALVDPALLGPIQGKMVISLEADVTAMERWKRSAAQVGFMGSNTRQFTLSEPALREAAACRVTGIGFVPLARLTPETVLSRFGPASQRLTGPDGADHHLHEALGLDIALHPSQGKDVLQYVAPSEFHTRLLRPLQP